MLSICMNLIIYYYQYIQVGAGLHYESVAHWDAKSDAAVVARYENETMVCLCTVVGVAL